MRELNGRLVDGLKSSPSLWRNRTDDGAPFAIPQDSRLPGLTTLLDSDTVKARLEPQIRETGGRVLDCRVTYVRYRPGSSCTASYEVTCQNESDGAPQILLWYGTCFTAEAFTKAYEKVITKPQVKPPFGQPVTALADHEMLLFAYPNDRRLDGLRILEDEDTLRRFLFDHLPKELLSGGEGIRATVIRYKPENRAVLRCESSETAVYLRVYPNGDRAAAVHSIAHRLLQRLVTRAELAIPEPLAFDRDRNILFVNSLPGTTLTSAMRTAYAHEAFERTARALATLHGHEDPEVSRWTVADHLARAQRAICLLVQFAPELKKRIEEIGRVLHVRAPRDQDCSFGFVHGDFHYGQVLVHPTKLGFLDFDRSHAGPVAADIGNLLAHLRYRRLKGRRIEDDTLTNVFLEAYVEATQKPLASEAIHWWTALALLQISVKPIRRLDANGPEKVKEFVKEIEGVLQRE